MIYVSRTSLEGERGYLYGSRSRSSDPRSTVSITLSIRRAQSTHSTHTHNENSCHTIRIAACTLMRTPHITSAEYAAPTTPVSTTIDCSDGRVAVSEGRTRQVDHELVMHTNHHQDKLVHAVVDRRCGWSRSGFGRRFNRRLDGNGVGGVRRLRQGRVAGLRRGGLRLGAKVELVGALLAGGRLDPLRVVREARLGEDAALLGEVDAVHEQARQDDDPAQLDEAVVELLRADDELARDERARVAASADHARDHAEGGA